MAKSELKQIAKTIEVALTFGDKAYTKTFKVMDDSKRNKYILEKLLERIQQGSLAHSEYWTAIRGIQFALQTGRVSGMQNIYLHRMDMTAFLLLVAEIKANCTDIQSVVEFLNTLHITEESQEFGFTYKRVA